MEHLCERMLLKERMLLECGCVACCFNLKGIILDKEFLWAVFQWQC
ncbi:hypothetical protein KVK41_06515 [Helicobacter pylori]|nr:hypothetical protein KVK41_06515 [Helicobacter pylori]